MRADRMPELSHLAALCRRTMTVIMPPEEKMALTSPSKTLRACAPFCPLMSIPLFESVTFFSTLFTPKRLAI